MAGRGLNRRGWLIGSAAATLAGCAGPKSLVPSAREPAAKEGVDPHASPVYDVIVIGGGAAGIGAARTAQSYRRSVLVLEAQERFGGRALTDNATFSEVGFDLGAQFFGHCVSGNVLFGIAQAKGVAVVDFSTLPTYFFLGPNKAPDPQVASFVATLGGMTGDILSGGALIANASQDYPVSRITKKYLKDRWYENAIGIAVTTYSGAQPAQSSTQDLFDYIVGSPLPFTTPGDSYVLKSGMGNFIQALGNGLPVKFGAVVKRIVRDATGVTVVTTRGTYRAKTAVVTVSTGVLGAGAIEFVPGLPATTRDAIAALPLGLIYKCALGFNTDLFPQFKGAFTVVTQLSKQPAISYFANFWNYNIVEILADADIAVKIESMSRTGQIDYLLKRLEENVPGAAAAFDGRFTASNWGKNPYTHGSYSRATVGNADARETLRAPVGRKIWFAGEALAETSTITLLQGAYNSGIAAASGALQSIGVKLRGRGIAG